MFAALAQRLVSLRMATRFVDFIDNPESLNKIIGLADSIAGTPLSRQMVNHLLDNPTMAALIVEYWRPAPIVLEILDTLPPSSLGYIYSRHMRRQGLSPASVIDTSPITSSHEYIFHRVRETHDFIHVLTGFGIDAAGELGVQGFILAQIRSPLAVFFIFGGILASLKNQLPLDKLLKALARGFELGLQAQCVIACKLEEGWDRPLADWQQELGLPVSQTFEA